VLEWFLPDASGLELLAGLQLVSPATRSVIVTAHASIPAALTALRAGATDYMTKPVSAAQILSALGALDSESEQAESLAEHAWTLQQARREYIRDVLDECQSIAKTARVLHLDRTSLRRMLSRFDLSSRQVSSPPAGSIRTAARFSAAALELPPSFVAESG
jgi:two-component system response regulator RegA